MNEVFIYGRVLARSSRRFYIVATTSLYTHDIQEERFIHIDLGLVSILVMSRYER
jgi:hypothetical protein